MNQGDICWYHNDITSQEGAKLLLLEYPNQINGLFIVRKSSTSPSDYTLSVLFSDHVYHYQIRKRQSDFFSINDSKKLFHGLENLIDYYKQNPLDGNGPMLTEYIKGTQPPHETRRSGYATNLLHRATNEGDIHVVRELLRANYPGSDAKTQDGKTAAHIAAIRGFDDILTELIKYNINVTLRDATGATPLHYAAKYNLPSTVSLLVNSAGKDLIQARNTENDEVPLHVAAAEGHVEVVKELLSLGAPPKPRNKAGRVPAFLAFINGFTMCSKIIDEYKVPVPCRGREEFYHGTLHRQEAEEKIMNYNPSSGTYLVRHSVKLKTEILTIFHEKIWNYVIRTQQDKGEKQYYIDNGPLWSSLEQLISYYSSISDGLPAILVDPVPPAPKPVAPPIATLKKSKFEKVLKPKPKLPMEYDDDKMSIFEWQNIAFTSDLSLANNNNNFSVENIDPNMLECGEIIGEGEFASVYKGVLVRGDKRENVAIKTLRNTDNQEIFLKEAALMMQFNHKCIVKLLGICPPLQMVQELVPLGSMLVYIKQHKDDIKPNVELKIWASQIASGMAYLEERKCVHRDLAARNILLATRTQAKIGDFGLSRALEANRIEYRARQGGKWPLKWYAPESYKFGKFEHKSDVWSFGVTIWEMYSFGEYPYGDLKGSEAIQLIENGERLKKPRACPQEIYDKMRECWAIDQKLRPTFRQLANFFDPEATYYNTSHIRDEHGSP